jgi:hypothetical protein
MAIFTNPDLSSLDTSIIRRNSAQENIAASNAALEREALNTSTFSLRTGDLTQFQ